MKTRNTKTCKENHVSRSKNGMGDFGGVAIKQKVGRPISIMTETPSKNKKTGKPPKALA